MNTATRLAAHRPDRRWRGLSAPARSGQGGPSREGGPRLQASRRRRQPLIRFDQQALTTEVIDQRQQPEPPPVEQLVGHEVHRPALVHPPRLRRLRPRDDAATPTRLVPAQAQPFELVQPMDTPLVHGPALPSQLDPHTQVAPRHVLARDLLDPSSQRRLIVLHRCVPLRRSCMPKNPARTPLAHPVRLLRPMNHRTPTIRPQLTSWAFPSERPAGSAGPDSGPPPET
jgi:hypothetical protein